MENKGDIVGADEATQGGFLSEFTHTLDAKRRIIIPSDWRELTGVPRRLAVLPAVGEKCLQVFPAREWAMRVEKLRNVSSADETKRKYLRQLAARAELVAWDVQGRIRIKDELLAYASLTGQVRLVGALDHFEIWEPESWKSQSTNMEDPHLKDAVQSAGL